jgi:hypothetical protein
MSDTIIPYLTIDTITGDVSRPLRAPAALERFRAAPSRMAIVRVDDARVSHSLERSYYLTAHAKPGEIPAELAQG